jgi:arsenate reductase
VQVTGQPRILFVSKGNAARSQIAEAILRRITQDRAIVASAGISPAREIHPLARDAVRRVFTSANMEGQTPKDVAAFASETFDYVFTVANDVGDIAPLFPAAIHEYWPFVDPAFAVGGVDVRQREFDKVARSLVKRLRTWWRPHRSGRAAATQPRADKPRLPSPPAPWRTHPPAGSPTVVFIYMGAQRQCVNICSYLTRLGYFVLCGDKYGRNPERLGFFPDAIVIRADGLRVPGMVRQEFKALLALRKRQATTPTLVVFEHAPSKEELEIAAATGATALRFKNNDEILLAIDQAVSQRRS